MANLILFEDGGYADLLPLVYWRSVFELRVGRRIILDHVAQTLERPIAGIWTRDWIASVASQRCMAPANEPIKPGDVLVNGRWLADAPITMPEPPCAGRVNGSVAFIVCDEHLAQQLNPGLMLSGPKLATVLDGVRTVDVGGTIVRYLWDVIAGLANRLTGEWQDGSSLVESDLDTRVVVTGRDRLSVGERSVVHPTVVLDASAGPIFISHDVTIGAGCVIEGPVYIGPGTRINPRAWLHGGNAIGPVCKIGGEIDGCIICGYTNKQHDGFLGHSFVGSWVNIGAGTNNSDLKNTYGLVRVPLNGVEVDTKQQFFGAMIGDHAKLGINATIPTGAVVGIGANVVTTRALPKFVPSLSWVTEDGVQQADAMKLLDVADTVMKRRNMEMTDAEVDLFHALPDQATAHEQVQ